MTDYKNFISLYLLHQKRLRILDLLAYKGELTKEIKMKVLATSELSSLEELYTSYNSNNQTREFNATKQYLEPLAAILWRQEKNVLPQNDALAFIDPAVKINSRDEALAGARDIIAEWIRNNQEAKKELKTLLRSHGSLDLEIIKEGHPELAYYKEYISTSTVPLTTKTDHIFKILEAESKGILSLSISVPQENYLPVLEKFFIKKNNAASQQVRMAMEDSYQRFLLPYLEMEIRTQLLEDAFQEILGPKKDLNKKTMLTKYLLIIPLVLLTILAFKSIPHPKPDGMVKEYYPNGQIKSIEAYLNGKRDGGFRKFLPDGKIIFLATYKNGVLNGESREYYDNGEWKIIKNYQDGLLEGPFKEYDQHGRLQHQIYYHNNQPIQGRLHE